MVKQWLKQLFGKNEPFNGEVVSFLDEQKQGELKFLVDLILEKASTVEMIILYGSYARNNAVEDKYVKDGITYEYISDFDLLIVVEDENRLPNGYYHKVIKKALKSPEVETPVSIIIHSIDFINKELESGNYFFVEVAKKQGKILYHSGQYSLAEPLILTPKEQASKAQGYFDQWIKIANSFITHFNYAMKDNDLNQAAFMLHQATEHIFNTILLVFTDYKPKSHDLNVLRKKCIAVDERFKSSFPLESKEDRRLYKLLNEAYINSRYKIGWRIELEDLEPLSKRVNHLHEITIQICKERIEEIGKQ